MDNKIEIVTIEDCGYSLEEMLAKISEDNIHKETETGSSVGKELEKN